MKKNKHRSYWLFLCVMLLLVSFREGAILQVTVPFVLDHNRMLVNAEFQRKDGTWCKAVLWVDSGNPDFFISESFAQKLGVDFRTGGGKQEVAAPAKVRIGGMEISFDSVRSFVDSRNPWLFNTMHNDGNLPSTVLKKYHVVFDYPSLQITIAQPGILKPQGAKSPATVHPVTGIVQMDAVIDGEKYSLALDNGASFSYLPDEMVNKLTATHKEWPTVSGAIGCANIWGYWPGEESWPLVRVPEIRWGSNTFKNVLIAGLPPFFSGKNLSEWYSRKTAKAVEGFLGPNVFRNCRVEIDYQACAIYIDSKGDPLATEMELVGLTLQPLSDGGYQVIGVENYLGKPAVAGVEPGDILLGIDDLKVTGATMGTVVDALRGKAGDEKRLLLEHKGVKYTLQAKVIRFL